MAWSPRRQASGVSHGLRPPPDDTWTMTDGGMSKRGATVVALAVGFVVTGQQPAPRANANSVEQTAQVCAACHGSAGVPVDPAIPVIWGQNEGYIYLQLRDMKRGSRKVEPMAPVIEPLERPDMQALAAYFAAKPWPDLTQPEASDDDARQALRANTSIGCTGCHLAGYRGAGTVPRLAGQQHAYLFKTMTDFRGGARGNNPGMTDLMTVAAEADLKALAAFFSGM
jgi:cytochrome c553